MTQTIEIELGERTYPILVGHGLLSDPGIFRPVLGGSSLVVTSETVAGLHLDALRTALDGHPHDTVLVPDGEAAKTLAQVERIVTAALDGGVGRDGSLIALGGGTTCDVAGFAAAVYMRGVSSVLAPTTLLAQADAAVGGKTAVNHDRGKNLIGAFHQPRRVIADTATLASLPARELSAGLAEVIKLALIADRGFFDWLEANIDALTAGDSGALEEAVARCCSIKAGIVSRDETDRGRRALLNLGHSFGHAIETASGGAVVHGEAVAAGCVMAAALSNAIGWLDSAGYNRIVRLIEAARLPVRPPAGLEADRLLELMRHDKKVAGGRIRLVLLRDMGEATLTEDYPRAALVMTLREFTTGTGR